MQRHSRFTIHSPLTTHHSPIFTRRGGGAEKCKGARKDAKKCKGIQDSRLTIHDYPTDPFTHSPFNKSLAVKDRYYIEMRIAHAEFDVLFDAEALEAFEVCGLFDGAEHVFTDVAI